MDSIKRSNDDDLKAWDNIQMKLMCCGVDNPADWREMSRDKTLRASCCRPELIDKAVGNCADAAPSGRDKYFQVRNSFEDQIILSFALIFFFQQDGCVGKLRERIDKNAVILIGVGLGIAFIQILGIVLALYLASKIRHERVK